MSDAMPGDLPLNVVTVGDISISNVDFEETVALIAEWAELRSGGYVCTPNADHIVQAHRSISFRDAVDGARLRVPDGMWIVYAARIAGTPLRSTVTGRLLVVPLCARLWEAGRSVAFVGAGPGIAARAMNAAATTLRRAAIGIAIAPPMGFEIGSDEDARVVAQLREVDPAVIFVALGAPRQELWMRLHASDLPHTVMVGVGAAFDIMAGRYREAPRWMTRRGLEWLFRLAQEPRRLTRRYLVDDPWLLLWAVRARLRQRAAGKP